MLLRIPRSRSELPLAIDIGTLSIKLLQLATVPSTDELKVVCVDKIDNQRQALENLIKRSSKISSNTSTCFSADSVQAYDLTFPQMPPKELEEAIHLKIKQLKPFGLSIEEVEYRFIEFGSLLQQESLEQKILLFCVSKQLIKERVELLKKVGLKAAAIGIEPCALINAYNHDKDRPKNEVIAWLDLGAKTSSLAISKNQTLCFIKPLAQTSSYAANLENLVVDVEHSFKNFSYQITRSQITKFDRLVLSGEGSNLKNLDRLLSEKLKVPVQRIQYLTLAPEFATCLGLAQTEQTKNQINFLSKQEKKLSKEFVTQWIKEKPLKAIVLVLAFVFLLIGSQAIKAAFYSQKLNSLSSAVKQAKLKLTQLQTKQLKITKESGVLQEKNAVLKARLDFLENALGAPHKFSEILFQIAALLPKEVWIKQLTYSKNELTLSGSTADISLPMQMLESLKASENITNAIFIYSQKEINAKIYNFEITAEIK